MKKIPLVFVFGVLITLFFVPVRVSAMIDSKVTSDDVIYSDYNKKDITETYIFYKGDPVTDDFERIENNILYKNNTYKIYALPFYDDGNFKYYINYATTTTDYFNNNLKKDTQLFSFYDLFIRKVLAQTILTEAGDGRVQYNNANWTTTRNSLTGTANYTNGNADIQTLWYGSGSEYYIGRGYFPFDTSSLPDTDVCIATSSLFIKPISHNDWGFVEEDLDYFIITSNDQASETQLVTGDYDELGLNAFSQEIDEDDLVNGTFAEFILNATATATIDTTGVTQFGLRSGYDFENNSPDTGGDLGINFNAYMSEHATPSNRPYLEVGTYSCIGEEPPTATSTSMETGAIPIFNDITVISGYSEIYTDSSTTPSEVRYHAYHIPALAIYFIVWIFLTLFMRLILELIIIYRNKDRR